MITIGTATETLTPPREIFREVIRQGATRLVIAHNRFHVMKLVNDELNLLRKKVGVTTKESKYLLLKNQSELENEEKLKLDLVLSQSSCLRIAYELKEEFREIYETSRGVKSGFRNL